MIKKRNFIIISSATIIILIIIGVILGIFSNKSHNTASEGELNVEKNTNEDIYKDSINNKSDGSTSDKKQETDRSDTDDSDISSSGSDVSTNEVQLENDTTQKITNQIEESIEPTTTVQMSNESIENKNPQNAGNTQNGTGGSQSTGSTQGSGGSQGAGSTQGSGGSQNSGSTQSTGGSQSAESTQSTGGSQNSGNTQGSGSMQNPESLSDIDEVIRLVNIERQKNGLSPLKKNNELCNVATARANEITVLFEHTRPNGSSFSTIMKEFNISYRAVGENIAAGQRTAAEVMDDWMNSQGHRENILSTYFGEIGVGCVKVKDDYGVYWVQIFKN